MNGGILIYLPFFFLIFFTSPSTSSLYIKIS